MKQLTLPLPYIVVAMLAWLFLFCVLIGNFTPTHKKFDYIMTAIIPVVVLSTLFISLYFDEGCDGKPQFSIHHALNMEYYRIWLPTTSIMALTTFISSFKPFRNFRIIKRKTRES